MDLTVPKDNIYILLKVLLKTNEQVQGCRQRQMAQFLLLLLFLSWISRIVQ